MGNISIDINLRQLKHAVITTKKGAKCLLIPIESNQLIEGEKGVYLNATGFEIKNKTEGQKSTHLVKQSLKKEVYEAMTEEQKKEMPILGNLTVWANDRSEPEPSGREITGATDPESDDLPF